jgi:hypothetical protein
MADPATPPADDDASAAERDPQDDGVAAGTGEADDVETVSTAELRRQVERKYDFEDFGPDDMAEMSAEEWEVAFDPDTWITGPELLDRVEADLKNKVLTREVFARVERLDDGRVLAYSDQGYAMVHPDGTVEGFGTVLRDVKPIVALCSMDEYEVADAPEGEVLPEPTTVPEGSGELGNLVLQVIAGTQLLAGVVLLLSWLLFVMGVFDQPTAVRENLNLVLLVVAGLAFIVVGLFLFMVVANARLSEKFRAEEFRDRLRATGLEDGERPDFLPVEDDEWSGREPTRLDRGGGNPPGEESNESGADG